MAISNKVFCAVLASIIVYTLPISGMDGAQEPAATATTSPVGKKGAEKTHTISLPTDLARLATAAAHAAFSSNQFTQHAALKHKNEAAHQSSPSSTLSTFYVQSADPMPASCGAKEIVCHPDQFRRLDDGYRVTQGSSTQFYPKSIYKAFVYTNAFCPQTQETISKVRIIPHANIVSLEVFPNGAFCLMTKSSD